MINWYHHWIHLSIGDVDQRWSNHRLSLLLLTLLISWLSSCGAVSFPTQPNQIDASGRTIMQRAEQELLLQNSNQEVLAIRQQELTYFSTFFNSFSLQAALLAGFVLNSLNDNEYDRFAGHQLADYVYWIFSAVLFAAALHCILTTVYCTVYGAGLALRGPVGSMVRAVDGDICVYIIYTFNTLSSLIWWAEIYLHFRIIHFFSSWS